MHDRGPFHAQWLWALILLSIVYGAITFQQPAMFAVCLDIGGEYGGAVTGAMNSAAQMGSFVSSIAFGYLVEHYGSYNVPFIPMAALLAVRRLAVAEVRSYQAPVLSAATIGSRSLTAAPRAYPITGTGLRAAQPRLECSRRSAGTELYRPYSPPAIS